jgi:hypothetical protein
MNPTILTSIIVGIIALLFAAVVIGMIKKRRRGEHICSCGGNCAACGLCPGTKQNETENSK